MRVITERIRSWSDVVQGLYPVDSKRSQSGVYLNSAPEEGDDLRILDMVAEDRFVEQRSKKSTDDDSLSKYQDALQDLDLDTAPEAREYLLRVLGMNPTEADEELLRASLPSTMHHAYYTNHMKPWIQIKTHNRHNQHARAERGPPQVVGERAGTNHSQVPHPGLYAVRMNNTKFPVGVRSTMYPQYENRSNQPTPQNKQHRSRSKKWIRRRVNGKWTKVPVKQPTPKMSNAEKLLKEVNELTTQLFQERLNYWMKEAEYVAESYFEVLVFTAGFGNHTTELGVRHGSEN